MAKFQNEPQAGDIVYAAADYLDVAGAKRLSKGKGYLVSGYEISGLWIKACDAGHNCCWGSDWQKNFTLQPTAPFTLLDDEGRKALKAGDRVLVEFDVREVDNEDSTVLLERKYDTTSRPWLYVKDVFALLPPAEKPIAVGDFVNILGRTGSRGKVLAFMSNGHAVVEYVAGDDFNVSHYDPSCLKVI